MGPYILVIDQSTAYSRACVFDGEQNIVGNARMDVTQHFPKADWVEQVAEEIWATCLWVCKSALREAGIRASDLSGMGIANQRATTIVWERGTGRAIANAIVWRDPRTADECRALKAAGHAALISERTGLIVHPYYSATKLKWLLDNVAGARKRAAAGELAFGTIDSFLIYRLTGGRVHATDATNASQTTLFNIETNQWDPDLLDLFDVPANILPKVMDSADDFGSTELGVFGTPVPILSAVGNQQAALIGQACFDPGMLKATYDDHCFMLMNTGSDIVRSRNGHLSTIAYRLDGRPTYALEGAIVAVSGSLRWLHDDLEIVNRSQIERLAGSAPESKSIYLVPAFVGAGADWWEQQPRGALFGARPGTRRADMVRAALEAIGYQSHDLIETMREDWGQSGAVTVRVDGGMVYDWVLQFLADINRSVVDRSSMADVTPLGAGWLAGRQAGVWPDAEGFAAKRVAGRQFEPRMDEAARDGKLAGWRDAVARAG